MTVPRPPWHHRFEYFLYRCVEGALARLDMTTCCSLGRGLGALTYRLSGRYRRLVTRNLRIATALQPLPESELKALVQETFRRGGANLLASLKTQILPVDELAQCISPEALQQLAAHRAAGVGTMVAMAHMGNWEALTRLGSKVLEPGTYGGVYRPLDNALMDQLTEQRRTSTGARLFSRKDGYYAPATFLREGGALAVLGDQRAGAHGVAMPFLGKLTTCPPLLELMARRGRARIAILEMRTTALGHWQLDLRPLPPQSTTPAIMAALETTMRSSIADVFWFHDRWRANSEYPLSLFTKLDPATAATATVPLRLLLTTPPEANETSVQHFLRRLLEMRPDLRIERLQTASARSEDPRVLLHPWDPETPETFADSFLATIDRTHPAPLDAFLLFGSELALARAARRNDHKAILGFQVQGKPWSRSLTPPSDLAGWTSLAESLHYIPRRHQKP
ncbi:lauroyl/myristoyl acyltransferase [Haloferula luteola]|uniref:Lauroyl/myristoyl acyltransferase n=1 Tax=Haloferula luteola TaxID=595692 RepID=A0A840UY24_9BACT|nr:lauroyl/myristoyl acyltransferase [Haloferula luteola]